MKKILFITSVLLCFVNMQCDKDDTFDVDSDNLLIGSWTAPVYDGEKTTFKRTSSLPEDSYGLVFEGNGVFKERSSGWCGTPPLFFSDFAGQWQLEDDVITVTFDYFPYNYSWKIVLVSEEELVIKRELTDQEEDHQELLTLFDEIYELSRSVSCTDASDWAFAAYGSKACGGPQGFIAYSNQINIDAFLQKIEEYTGLENAYNIKWGIVSTCDLPQQPKGVKCENGFPVLSYSSNCGQSTIIDENLYANLESAHFTFTSAQIIDNCLKIEISSSGCDGNSWGFKLVDSGAVAESSPEQRYLKFQLINTELCDAVFERTVFFDLTSLQINGSNEIILNLEGWESSLNYKY